MLTSLSCGGTNECCCNTHWPETGLDPAAGLRALLGLQAQPHSGTLRHAELESTARTLLSKVQKNTKTQTKKKISMVSKIS